MQGGIYDKVFESNIQADIGLLEMIQVDSWITRANSLPANLISEVDSGNL